MKRIVFGGRSVIHWLGATALIGTLLGGASIALTQNALAQSTVSLPKATLVPVQPWKYTSPDLTTISRDSVELMSADRYLKPEYLSQEGYVEEEYLISGTANVYDWGGDGKQHTAGDLRQ